MSLEPNQALFLRDNAIRSMKMEQPLTQRVIEAIPLDKGDYRPDTVGKSAVDLAWHIVGAEHRFIGGVLNGVFDFSNTERPAALHNSAEIARWYADTAQRDLANLVAAPAETLLKIVDFRGMFQLPAVAYLDLSLRHAIHHRGQLSMYLRPMGAKVPSVYGPSADDKQFR